MNPLNYLNPMEQQLCNRADLKQIPIAGNIELLPLCNMDCKMCFAKMKCGLLCPGMKLLPMRPGKRTAVSKCQKQWNKGGDKAWMK